MGAFDRIVFKTKCPYCSYISDFEFQIDSLGQTMRTFRKNDKIKALDFVIKEGVIKDCGEKCDKCNNWFYADFIVKDGKLIRVKKIKRMKKKEREFTKEEIKKEIEKVEKIAKIIGKKWPKGKSSVDIIREERR